MESSDSYIECSGTYHRDGTTHKITENDFLNRYLSNLSFALSSCQKKAMDHFKCIENGTVTSDVNCDNAPSHYCETSRFTCFTARSNNSANIITAIIPLLCILGIASIIYLSSCFKKDASNRFSGATPAHTCLENVEEAQPLNQQRSNASTV